MNKDLDYYMALPYKVVLIPCDEGGYVAEIPDLKGCITQAETKEEIVGMIEDAKGFGCLQLWRMARRFGAWQRRRLLRKIQCSGSQNITPYTC